MLELKPCPNCGNKTDFSFNVYDMDYGTTYGLLNNSPKLYESHVQCLDCDLSTGTACPYETEEEAKQHAAIIWNNFVDQVTNKDIDLITLELAKANQQLEALRQMNSMDEWGPYAKKVGTQYVQLLIEKRDRRALVDKVKELLWLWEWEEQCADISRWVDDNWGYEGEVEELYERAKAERLQLLKDIKNYF